MDVYFGDSFFHYESHMMKLTAVYIPAGRAATLCRDAHVSVHPSSTFANQAANLTELLILLSESQ